MAVFTLYFLINSCFLYPIVDKIEHDYYEAGKMIPIGTYWQADYC